MDRWEFQAEKRARAERGFEASRRVRGGRALGDGHTSTAQGGEVAVIGCEKVGLCWGQELCQRPCLILALRGQILLRCGPISGGPDGQKSNLDDRRHGFQHWTATLIKNWAGKGPFLRPLPATRPLPPRSLVIPQLAICSFSAKIVNMCGLPSQCLDPRVGFLFFEASFPGTLVIAESKARPAPRCVRDRQYS